MITLLAAVLLLSSAPAAPAKTTHWGAEQKLTVAPTALAKAITETRAGDTVLVTATADSVCLKKGCWVVLKDGDATVRVTMKDYGFFLPKDVKGKTLVVEGVLEVTEVAEGSRKHYAKDEGKSDDEIAKIKGDTRDWSLVASSIKIAE